jgi:hypothetical protein
VGAKNFGDAGGRIVAVQPLTQMVFEIVACVTFQ